MGKAPILFCSHVVEWGGAETVLADLLGALDRSRFAPHLACPGPGPLPARAEQLGVPVHAVPMGGRSPWRKACSVPRAARRLRALARQLDCHLLVANTMIAGYAAVLAQTDTLRCLWHLHIVTHSRLARFALRRATAVVAPSAAGATAVDARLATSRRLRVIPNGVAQRFFEAAGTGLRSELGLPDGTPLLGIVGRLDPHKGHEVLLRAFASLDSKPAPHLVVVGGEAFADSQARVGGYAARLQRHAAEAGLASRTHLLGHADDPAPILSQLDVVVVPSVTLESAPRSICEAQAAGRAVVASAIGGIPELVTHGETGLLTPPGDAAALAAALARLLADPAERQRLGAQARAHATADYGMPVFARRFGAACLAALGQSAPEQ
ncbi:MAG TPA: glycosyltransferase family 4 protein [Planctomycetota bacterium]|nr:glycosyltransferase family 4 protein [Planctomycetota bacterium]